MDVRISVLMSAYNAEMYIRESISSLLRQTFKDFELLITDDLSDDLTVDIVKSFHDNRIRLFQNKERRGLTANLISMLSEAKGEYIARLDADDLSERKRLEAQKEYLDRNPDCKMVCSYAKAIGSHRGIIKTPVKFDQIKACLLFYNPVVHSSVMFRNQPEIVYDAEFLKSQDYALWDSFVDKDYCIGTIRKPLVRFRYHEGQISNKKCDEQNHFRDIVRARALLRMGVETSAEERVLWFNFLDGYTELSLKEVETIAELLDRIGEQNQTRMICSSSSMRKMLDVYYYNLYLIIKKRKYKSAFSAQIAKKTPLYRKMIGLVKHG